MSGTLVISGGSHGIGRATVASFLQSGWRVVNLSRTPCEEPAVHTIRLDLAGDQLSDDAWKYALARAVPAGGRLCIVHNAGEFVRDSTADVDVDYLQRAFRLMVLAPSVLNSLLLPGLAEHSSIIYVGSTLSELGVSNAFSYIAIKHAVVGMMRATQQDMAGRGVHSCCVCPGVTQTRMIAGDDGRPTDFAATRVSMRRLLRPGEVADVIRFAADNPSINGAVIHANLGQENC
jgi:NAD(P)-dependent dehydrogenase (short-subunit alcohol dehydrogenase family)